jgi:hypothetical protein
MRRSTVQRPSKTTMPETREMGAGVVMGQRFRASDVKRQIVLVRRDTGVRRALEEQSLARQHEAARLEILGQWM